VHLETKQCHWHILRCGSASCFPWTFLNLVCETECVCHHNDFFTKLKMTRGSRVSCALCNDPTYFILYYTRDLVKPHGHPIRASWGVRFPDLTWCTPVCTCQWCFPPKGFSADRRHHGGPEQLHACRMDTWNGPRMLRSLLLWEGMDSRTVWELCTG